MKHLLTICVLLLALTCCTTEADRNRMRAGLDSINVRNRNGQPFTTADVQPYVDFFNEHGTPNDRLLAHYLLGLAYYDHGEAPMALQCYQDAADCADTTAADCDFAQLARVYGQMAQVFCIQGLYQEQLQKTIVSVKYAWKGRDTLLALRNYEQEGFVYLELKDTVSALAVMEKVARQFKALGYIKNAVITLGGNIRPLIDMGDYDKAKDYINMYEAESGRFDSCGNIESGREIYYKSKGLYYLHTNKLDSAEYYFRKELHDGKDFNNQNAAANGLTLLYKKLHRPDSMAKYALYAYIMLDSVYARRTTEEVERMQSMYNYTRHQEIAYTKSKEAQEEKQKRVLLSVIFMIIIIIGLWFTISILQKQKENLCKYKQTLEDLRQVRLEKEALTIHEEEYHQIIAEKDKKIAQGEKIIKKYGKLQYFTTANAERCLNESPSYKALQRKAIKGETLSATEWEGICMMIREYFPGFDDFMETHRPNLKDIEYQTCLLLRLHFKAIDIAGCLSVSKSKISQVCTEIMRKSYQSKGSSKELSAKLTKIF